MTDKVNKTKSEKTTGSIISRRQFTAGVAAVGAAPPPPGAGFVVLAPLKASWAAFLSAGVCPENCLVGENSPNL